MRVTDLDLDLEIAEIAEITEITEIPEDEETPHPGTQPAGGQAPGVAWG
jgi:hypothetical protein